MANFGDQFRVEPGKKWKLADVDPSSTWNLNSKQEANGMLQKNIADLADLQIKLAAESKRALLVILQGMDAGGKDGTIRHVMTGVNPQGCRVTSFKVPAGVETEHDYLWRIHQAAPRFGEIGIFNRSHYEDVLVVRIHELVDKSVWSKRYDHINAFEKMLSECGTRIVKFFLYISPGEQKKRIEQRMDDPHKNWKISPTDFSERKRWNEYMEAYEDAIRKCSTAWAPWYVIPANRKWFRNLAVSEIIEETLREMDPKYPKAAMDFSKVRLK